MKNQLTKEELVALVKEIITVKDKTEEQISELIDKLKQNVSHPEVGNLIYWEDLSREEIVDKALDYKAIQL